MSAVTVKAGDRVAWTARALNGQWKQWPATVNQTRGDMALITLDVFPWTGRDVPMRELELLEKDPS